MNYIKLHDADTGNEIIVFLHNVFFIEENMIVGNNPEIKIFVKETAKEIEDILNREMKKQKKALIDAIDETQAEDVKKNVYGEWIEQKSNGYVVGHVCSICGRFFLIDDDGKYEYKFCPNCGADMRETIEQRESK